MAVKAPLQRRETEHRILQGEHPPLQRKQHIEREPQRTNGGKTADRHRTSQRRNGSTASGTATISAPDQQYQHLSAAQNNDNETVDDEMLCSALKRVTVVVLGARGVGKTSLVRQFVYGDSGCADDVISTTHHSTVGMHSNGHRTMGCGRQETDHAATTPNYHHVAVVVDRHLYDVRVVDCPPISRFPTSAVQEWTDYRGYGLRHATAYIIVYDVTDEESFAYVRSMREQIVRCRAAQMNGSGSSGIGGGLRASASANTSLTSAFDVPIIVAANKVDLIAGGISGSGSGVASYVGNMVNGSGLGERIALTAAAVTGRQQRDVANVVRKQWKCAYVECSARFNWRVVSLFRDLMKAVDIAARQQQQQLLHHHHSSHLQSAAGSLVRVHDALHNNHCCIL